MADLTCWRAVNGVEVLHLTALEALDGVAAIFTGRRGGVSPRWDGGLNWSYSVGDDPAHVRENRLRTLGHLGVLPEQTVMGALVHGDRVAAVTAATAEPGGRHADFGALTADPGPTLHPGPGLVRVVPDCDALISDRPGVALVVTAADCVPVYLFDPVRRAIGVIHAGWRGTVAGIAGKAAAAMAARFGCDPADIVGAVGPSIGPCCYEVDDAVADPLRARYGAGAAAMLGPGRVQGKYQLNLWAANRQDLLDAGLRVVYITGECTACKVERYFSHRAEAGKAGRGAAIMMLK